MSKLEAILNYAKISQENISSDINHQREFLSLEMQKYHRFIVEVSSGNSKILGLVNNPSVSVHGAELRLELLQYKPKEQTPITKLRRVVPFSKIDSIKVIAEYKRTLGGDHVHKYL